MRNGEDAKHWRIEGARDIPVVNIPYFGFIDDDAAATAQVPTGLGEAIVVCAKGEWELGRNECAASAKRAA